MIQTVTEPLLSIVVPTRNRYATLNVIVEQFLSWDSDAFELVIEDNSDGTSGFAPVLERYRSDERLRYSHHKGPRSAVENCDAAVARATGKVLTFIGDDDSVTRHCIEAAQWMIDNDIEALVCGVAGYTWPDMEHAVAINQGYNGKLVTPESRGMSKPINVASELGMLARLGAQRIGNMPRLYQAMVQRKALDRAVAVIGRYFPGPVPDMANAVSLAKYVGTCRFTDVPLVVAGQSRSSMSGQNSIRKHQGDVRQEKSLPADTADRWDPRIPRYWSAPTIWAETAIKAAEITQQQGFVDRFSFARVYAACFAFNQRVYYPLVFDAMRYGGWTRAIALAPAVLWHLGMTTAQRAKTFLNKLLFGFPGESFEDVAQATAHVEAIIDREGLMAKLCRSIQT